MKAAGWLIVLAAVAAGCEAPKASREYQEAYVLPLVSPGTKFGNLPPAVQHTIRAEAGGAEINDIMRDTTAGRAVYRITFVKDDLLPPLYVAQDGSVLNPDLTLAISAPPELGALPSGATGRLTLNDLPAKVAETIQQQAPNTWPATIDKVPYGNQTVFVVTFEDPRQPKLYINSDGVILGERAK